MEGTSKAESGRMVKQIIKKKSKKVTFLLNLSIKLIAIIIYNAKRINYFFQDRKFKTG